MMPMIRFSEPLRWGALDVPLLGITHDWNAAPLAHPAGWSLAVDAERLWFVASHAAAATIHPQARPSRFLPELWKFDLAELFLADPRDGRYLELNLAPNGAWWSAEFTGKRELVKKTEGTPPEIATFAELAPDGAWVAAMAIPLDWLRARIDFGETTTGNVAFILGSPDQRFLSAFNLGGGEPDFHQPERFPPLSVVDRERLGLNPGG